MSDAQNSEVTPDHLLTIAFQIPQAMTADLQMMAVWQKAWRRFEHETKVDERLAALEWFYSWASAEIKRQQLETLRQELEFEK